MDSRVIVAVSTIQPFSEGDQGGRSSILHPHIGWARSFWAGGKRPLRRFSPLTLLWLRPSLTFCRQTYSLFMQHHRHIVLGAERNRVENFDAMTGNKCPAETLRDCGQQQRRFNLGDPFNRACRLLLSLCGRIWAGIIYPGNNPIQCLNCTDT